MSEINTLIFDCDDNLEQYNDSMLFDSDTVIAGGKFEQDDKTIEISLCVRGEVSVNYKGETYHKPSEFPDELKQLIKDKPYDWDDRKDIYVSLNNWFEYIYEIDGYSDGIMADSPFTEENILADMLDIAEEQFELANNRENDEVDLD